MKKVQVSCPVVDYALEENGKIVAWVLKPEKLAELLEHIDKKDIK